MYPALLFCLLALPAALVLSAGFPVDEGGDGLSRFDRIAVSLGTADAADRRAFALDAMNELYQVYSAESDLARREAADDSGDKSLQGWAGAVDGFSRRLLQGLEWVDGGAEVQVLYRSTTVELWLPDSGLRLLLEHPRQDQQAAFEQAVLSAFCRGARCSLLLAPTALEEPAPVAVTPEPVSVTWAFSAQGPTCSANGVSVHFRPGRSVDRLRDFCQQLHYELNAIALELRWQQSRGVQVDWQALVLARRSDRPGHVMRLNRVGDAALVEAPLVASSEGLLVVITPWLRAHSGGRQASVLLEASDWQWGG